MQYSPSTGGFYTPEIHGDAIPADAVEISDEQYARLIEGQSQGQRILAGPRGVPVLVENVPTDAERLVWCKTQARERLAATDYSQVPDVAAALLNSKDFKTYRTTVRALFLDPVLDPAWPEVPNPIWR